MAGRAPAADLAAELDAKLDGLCAVAQSSLDETWAEIGTSAEEERSAIVLLKEQLTAAFLSALTRETDARDQLRCDLTSAVGELQRAAAELGEDALLPAEVRTGALRTRVASAGRELEACRLRRAERARAADALDGEASALSAQLGEARVETRGTVREHAPLSGEALRLLDAEVRALRAEHASRESEWRRHRDAIVHLRAALAGEAAPLAVRGETPDLRLRTLVALRAELASLDELRRQRAGAIASIRARVSGICAQLGLQLDEATARAAATDVSELAVQGWRSELERLEKLRRASLARLVDEARAEVLALWAALGISLSAGERDRRLGTDVLLHTVSAQSGHAAPGTSNGSGGGGGGGGGGTAGAAVGASAEQLDSLLSRLGAELEGLCARQREAEPILRLRARRAELRAQAISLELSMADPTRLTSRRDPGRLLREERDRKVCSHETPRVTAKLLEALRAWEAHRAEPFVYENASLLEAIEAEEEFDRAEADAKRLQRSAPRPGAPPAVSAGASPASGSVGRGRVVYGGTTPSRSAAPGAAARLQQAFARAQTAPRPASAPRTGASPLRGAEPFRPVPLSLQQILAAAMVEDLPDTDAGAGAAGATPPADGVRKTLTYRLRDEATAAIQAAEAARRATVADDPRRPQSAREVGGTVRRTAAIAGHQPAGGGGGGGSGSASIRTVESVVALAARLKAEAHRSAAAAAASKGGAPSHNGTPSKAVLQAFAESNGVKQSPSALADLIDLMSPPQPGAPRGMSVAAGGNKENR